MCVFRLGFLVVVLSVVAMGTASGLDILVDDFDQATNTVEVVLGPGGVSDTTDSSILVIGGSRRVIVEDFGLPSFGTEGGVDLSTESLRIMQLGGAGGGDGRVTAIYDGDGNGLRNAVSCPTTIEVGYSSDEVEVGSVSVTIEDGTGASATSTLPVPFGIGVLSFPISDFAAVDLRDVAVLELALDMDVPANDFAVQFLQVSCPNVPAPAPATSFAHLAVALCLLSLCGFVGISKRRSYMQ